jgi:pantoate--beta-alanine ligase
MKIVKTIEELQNIRKQISTNVGFVPTMGALHDGHISLIKRAKEENDIVVVSIFVNPTQFLAGEDFEKYPSKDLADKEICSRLKVDILFMPDINTMYSKDEVGIKAPNTRGFILEGFCRPEHFDGVLQIVLKLFNIVQPTNSYFGKKDAQQLALIQQMVSNLFLPINIVPCDIVRDENGLALSSRNVYLSEDEKQKALNIVKSLRVATNLIMSGILDISDIKNEMIKTLKDVNIEYVEIVSASFTQLEKVELKNTIILVASKVGTTRLIDNIWI